jgi:hypothetical protein
MAQRVPDPAFQPGWITPEAMQQPYQRASFVAFSITYQSVIKSTYWKLNYMLMRQIVHEERWTKT